MKKLCYLATAALVAILLGCGATGTGTPQQRATKVAPEPAARRPEALPSPSPAAPEPARLGHQALVGVWDTVGENGALMVFGKDGSWYFGTEIGEKGRWEVVGDGRIKVVTEPERPQPGDTLEESSANAGDTESRVLLLGYSIEGDTMKLKYPGGKTYFLRRRK